MRYPEEYKCDSTKIVKFDRDYNKQLEYTFYGLFPIALNSTPVSYANSDILKVSASFNFDRYVCGKTSSYAVYSGSDNNLDMTFKGFNFLNGSSQGGGFVPMSAGAAGAGGVRFRPPNVGPGEAIVNDKLTSRPVARERVL